MKPEKPPVIKSPIAYNGDKRPIPASTPLGSNQLSFESGFPVLTATPLKAGGLPPDRLDFNAALNLLSSFTFFMQSGNQFSWNAELDYNPGAFVLGSDEALYFCTQANGATPPNTVKNPTTTTGYWAKVFSKQGVFNNDLIADGSITTAKIANNAINNAKISDVSASKVTGILPVANGGNGTNTGISAATQAALNGKQPTGDYATNARANEIATAATNANNNANGREPAFSILPVTKGGNGTTTGISAATQAALDGKIPYNPRIIILKSVSDLPAPSPTSAILQTEQNTHNGTHRANLALSSYIDDVNYGNNITYTLNGTQYVLAMQDSRLNTNNILLGANVRNNNKSEIAPKPVLTADNPADNTTSIGAWVFIHTDESQTYTLPRQGAWACFVLYYDHDLRVKKGYAYVVAGGTTFGETNRITLGFAWRIA